MPREWLEGSRRLPDAQWSELTKRAKECAASLLEAPEKGMQTDPLPTPSLVWCVCLSNGTFGIHARLNALNVCAVSWTDIGDKNGVKMYRCRNELSDNFLLRAVTTGSSSGSQPSYHPWFLTECRGCEVMV